MKKRFIKGLYPALLTASMLLCAVPAHADAPYPDPSMPTITTTNTDYYVIVDAANAEGTYMYSSLASTKPMHEDEPIPNQTILYIGEELSDGSAIWGHTEYKDDNGFVPMADCTIIDRLSAVNTELANGSAVDTDYDALVETEAGYASLYAGPGEKYGIIRGAEKIPNGTSLHIYLEATMPDGSEWAQTNFGDKEAWICTDDLDRTSAGLKADLAAANLDPEAVDGATVSMEAPNTKDGVSEDATAEDATAEETTEVTTETEETTEVTTVEETTEATTEAETTTETTTEAEEDTETTTEVPVEKAATGNASTATLIGAGGGASLLVIILSLLRKRRA